MMGYCRTQVLKACCRVVPSLCVLLPSLPDFCFTMGMQWGLGMFPIILLHLDQVCAAVTSSRCLKNEMCALGSLK